MPEERPQILRDRFANLWTPASDGSWEGREQPLFSDRPEHGNCFYLVFDPNRLGNPSTRSIRLLTRSHYDYDLCRGLRDTTL
jgi:hypothetical protein